MQTTAGAPMRNSQINSKVSAPARAIPADQRPSNPPQGKPAGSSVPGFSGTGLKPAKV